MACAAQGRHPASRHRSWCVSTDPEFAAKAADVIGVSEPTTKRSCTQCRRETLDPGAGKENWLRMHQQRQSRARSEEHLQAAWPINLFAALNVATGEIKSKTTHTKKRPIQAFMESWPLMFQTISRFTSSLTNYCTHKKNMSGWPSIQLPLSLHPHFSQLA